MGAAPRLGLGGHTLSRTWLVRAGQLVLTVLVTWIIVDRVGLGLAELQGIDRDVWLPSLGPLLAASAVLLIGYFASAALWGLLVRDLGGPTLPLGTSVPLFMIANLGRYVPGKVWQIAGLAALASARGVPATIATGAAVLGQGIALVAAAAIGTGALLAGPERYRPLALAAAAAVALLVLLLAVPAVFHRMAGAWFRVTRTKAPEALGRAHGVRWLALYIGNWLVYAVAFWILTTGIAPGGSLLAVGSAFAASYVLGYVMIFAPAGLGPREGFLIAFLTPHFGPATAGVMAIVARLWTTVVELLPAGIFWARYVSESSGSEGQGGE